MGAVAVLPQLVWIEHIIAHRHDDRAHLAGEPLLRRHQVIHRFGRARLGAAIAGQVVGRIVEAGGHVNQVRAGGRLGDGRVDGFARRHAGVILVGEHFGADERTLAAAGAGVGDVARALAHRHAEIAGAALHTLHLCQRENLDVGVQVHLRHLGRLDADGAIKRGEVLVEHGHHPADGRLALHQHHLRARFRQIERRLNPRDPSADDHYGIAHGVLLRLELRVMS